MKQGDRFIAILIAGFAIAALALWLWPKPQAAVVQITKDGELIATLPLSEDTTYPITDDDEENVVEISGGKARMASANCHDHTCVNSAAVSKNGETIVCLPHGIIITAVSGRNSEIDAVVQ